MHSSPKADFTVVGLDLSTTGTGLSSLWGRRGAIKHHTETLTRETKKTKWSVGRLSEFVESTMAFVLGEEPSMVMIEGYAHNVWNLAPLAELGGCIRMELHRAEIPFCIVAPQALKKFLVGTMKIPKGKAKVFTSAAMKKEWGVEFPNYDEADAYALSRMGAALIDQDQWAPLPKDRRDSFRSIHPSDHAQANFPRSLSRAMSR